MSTVLPPTTQLGGGGGGCRGVGGVGGWGVVGSQSGRPPCIGITGFFGRALEPPKPLKSAAVCGNYRLCSWASVLKTQGIEASVSVGLDTVYGTHALEMHKLGSVVNSEMGISAVLLQLESVAKAR